MKNIMKIFFALVIFLNVLSISAFASEPESMLPDEVWEDFEDSVPDEAQKIFRGGGV